jgi:hypothetical protein
VSVRGGLALAEQVEVRAVQNQDACHDGRLQTGA